MHTMPSAPLRSLTWMLAICFGLLGALLFVAPSWAAANFPWKISPFVAMTMGGWYLGSAYFAWESLRSRRWSTCYGCLAYLWTFGLGEAAMLVLYRGVLHLHTALAWPYIISVSVAALTALAGSAELLWRRPAFPPEGAAVPRRVRAQLILFVLYVFFLAFVLLTGRTRGAIMWRTPLTPLTAHAFGAFYLALVLGALVLVWSNGLAPVLAFMRAGLALIVPITLAALVYHTQFGFSSRPWGLLYFASYVGAGIGALVVIVSTRTLVSAYSVQGWRASRIRNRGSIAT